MSRRLLALNIVLAIVSIVLVAGIVRTLIVRRALPTPAAPRTATVPAPAPAPATENVDPGLSGYAVIAARNLFNPARSETAVATAPVAKPILHGVVMDGAKSRAFLEDPATKRVAGYSAGDMIGGGRIQRISDDRVVIDRDANATTGGAITSRSVSASPIAPILCPATCTIRFWSSRFRRGSRRKSFLLRRYRSTIGQQMTLIPSRVLHP